MEERQDVPNETKWQRILEIGRGDEELFAFHSNNIIIDRYLHFSDIQYRNIHFYILADEFSQ